jgi:dolichyl-phosphate-mannose-protein mannosyltransferase
MATTDLAEPDVTADPPPLPRPLWRPIPGNAVMAWLGPLLVSAFAFALRLYHLAHPAKVAFDEVYYSCDAHLLLKYGYEHAHLGENVCVVTPGTPGGAFVAHPPLGKWLIAMGEWVYGYDHNGGTRAAFGWRIAACIVGALSIFLLCRLGRRLFRSTLLGCFAGLLLALDGLHFVQSRMAMLDIFLMFFVLAAGACLVVDRDWGRRRMQSRLGRDRSWPGPALGFRPWRALAGLMLGCALGVKWSAVYYVAAFALLAFVWDVGARRAAGVRKPFLAALRRELLPVVLLLGLLPVAAYVATWTGWFVTGDGWRRTCAAGVAKDCGVYHGFLKYHWEMYNFHVHLHTPHHYQSRPWGWLLIARPVLYVYDTLPNGRVGVVLGMGTPAIWWGSILALLGTVWGWISRRDWRATFVLVGFAAGYLPWFWPAGRTEFFFYALPSLPFMCLALAYCAGLALTPRDPSPARRQTAVVVIAAYTLLVVVNFFYLLPILNDTPIRSGDWYSRMWFSSWI